MSTAMFFPRNRVKNQRFSYEPRYYNPTRDENIRQRMRIQGRSAARRKRPTNLLVILALLVMALYIFFSI